MLGVCSGTARLTYEADQLVTFAEANGLGGGGRGTKGDGGGRGASGARTSERPRVRTPTAQGPFQQGRRGQRGVRGGGGGGGVLRVVWPLALGVSKLRRALA